MGQLYLDKSEIRKHMNGLSWMVLTWILSCDCSEMLARAAINPRWLTHMVSNWYKLSARSSYCPEHRRSTHAHGLLSLVVPHWLASYLMLQVSPQTRQKLQGFFLPALQCNTASQQPHSGYKQATSHPDPSRGDTDPTSWFEVKFIM